MKKQRINPNAIGAFGKDWIHTVELLTEGQVTARMRRPSKWGNQTLQIYEPPGGGYAGETQNKGRYTRKPRAAR